MGNSRPRLRGTATFVRELLRNPNPQRTRAQLRDGVSENVVRSLRGTEGRHRRTTSLSDERTSWRLRLRLRRSTLPRELLVSETSKRVVLHRFILARRSRTSRARSPSAGYHFASRRWTRWSWSSSSSSKIETSSERCFGSGSGSSRSKPARKRSHESLTRRSISKIVESGQHPPDQEDQQEDAENDREPAHQEPSAPSAYVQPHRYRP